MIKISDRQRKYLSESFPFISSAELDDEQERQIKKYYDVFAISVFDRWLSEKEADDFLSEYLWQGSYADSHSNYKASEDKYLLFFQELSYLDRIYFVTDSLALQELAEPKSVLAIENSAELKKICLANIREKSFFRLFLPKLRIAIRGNFDFIFCHKA